MGCCKNFAERWSRRWMLLFNLFLIAMGLASLGISIYLISKRQTALSFTLMGISVYIVLMGIFGFKAVGTDRKCLFKLFVVLLLVFVLLQVIVVSAMFIDKDYVKKELNKMDDRDHDDPDAENYLSRHRKLVTYGGLFVCGYEVMTLVVLLLFRKKLTDEKSGDLYEVFLDEKKNRAIATPKTDEHRQRMYEKYGIGRP